MPSREHGEYSRAAIARTEKDSHFDALSESLSRLEQAVSEIQDSETFRRYLDAQARFHHYSWGNVLLILAARPDARQVAGYRTWQSMNRFVRRGEKGIRILVPMRRKAATESQDSDDEPDQASRLFFGTGHVFDIAQTEGEPLPQVAVPILEGDEGQQLYSQLETVAQQEGVSVQQAHELGGERMGYYDPASRQIVVRRAAARQMTKTLAHELAHHFSGATHSSPEEETIAESCAYVVCARFGLDTGERSFPYVATWSQEPRVFKAALTRIQAISSLIIERLEPKTDVESEPRRANGRS